MFMSQRPEFLQSARINRVLVLYVQMIIDDICYYTARAGIGHRTIRDGHGHGLFSTGLFLHRPTVQARYIICFPALLVNDMSNEQTLSKVPVLDNNYPVYVPGTLSDLLYR
jgi:hypothetical protein